MGFFPYTLLIIILEGFESLILFLLPYTPFLVPDIRFQCFCKVVYGSFYRFFALILDLYTVLVPHTPFLFTYTDFLALISRF